MLCFSPQTYSTLNVPSASYSWGGSFVTVSGSGYSVSATGTFSGSGNVNVSIASPHSGTTVQARKDILVGGNEPQIFDIPSTLCGGGTYLVYASPSLDNYYHWQVVGGTINSGQNGPSMQFTADYLSWPNTSGTVGITLTVTGECGTPFVKGISVPVTECGPGGGGMGWLVYPNPASESLSVGVIVPAEDTRYTAAAPVYRAILYDSQGKQLCQGDSKDGSVQFDTRSLAEGTYFLHIHHDGEVEKRQIVIRH